jgi:hypothetical protein
MQASKIENGRDEIQTVRVGNGEYLRIRKVLSGGKVIASGVRSIRDDQRYPYNRIDIPLEKTK